MNSTQRRILDPWPFMVLLIVALAALMAKAAHCQTCPPHKATINATLTRPVANNQVVCRWVVCDQDGGQTYTVTIIKGNTKGYFRITPTSLVVANAAAINQVTTRRYDITIKVADNGTPQGSNTTLIKITMRK